MRRMTLPARNGMTARTVSVDVFRAGEVVVDEAGEVRGGFVEVELTAKPAERGGPTTSVKVQLERNETRALVMQLTQALDRLDPLWAWRPKGRRR